MSLRLKAPRLPRKSKAVPKELGGSLRAWVPVAVGIVSITLGILVYKENSREKTARYLQDVDEVRKTITEPVLNSSKPVDKTVLANADRRLTTLTKERKDRPEALALHAVVANAMGEEEIAYSLANSALANDPDNPNALIVKGLLEQQKGKTRESEFTLRKAIVAATERQLPIEKSIAKLNLANQLIAQGRLSEADTLLVDPRHNEATKAIAYNTTAIISLRKGDLNQATKDFKEAVASDPDYVKALYNLACTLQSEGRNEEAQVYFGKIDKTAAELKFGSCPTGGGGGGGDVIPDAASKPGYWQICYEDC